MAAFDGADDWITPQTSGPGQFASDIRQDENSPAGAVSPKGATTPMQVMPATAAKPGFGIAPAQDPDDVARVGVDYANAMKARYGDPALAAAAYNAGPTNVDHWLQTIGDPRTGELSTQDFISKIPYPETRAYAQRELARAAAPASAAVTPATTPADDGLTMAREVGAQAAHEDATAQGATQTTGADDWMLPGQPAGGKDDWIQPGATQQIGPVDTGMLGAVKAGVVSAIKDIGQSVEAIRGQQPQVREEPNIVAAQPITMTDLVRPHDLAEKVTYGFARSFPSLAGGIVGGAAVAPVAGAEAATGIGAPAAVLTEAGGAAIGAAGADLIQEIGPQFAKALQETNNDPEAAWKLATERASISAGATGIGWRLFSWAPFQSTLKNVLFQAFGVQPAVSTAATAAQNVVEGKPALEGTGAAYPGEVAGTLVPMAGMGAIHAIKGRGTAPEAQPAPDSGQKVTAAPPGTSPQDAAAAQARADLAEATPVPVPVSVPGMPQSTALGEMEAAENAEAPPSAEEPKGDGTSESPRKVETPADIRAAEQQVTPQPTEAEKESGTYAKGHVDFQGVPVTIETAKGGLRQGPIDETGQPAWENVSPAAYGYVKRTVGADKENIDVYLGDDTASKKAFVVDQHDPATGDFDEHKAILGVNTAEEAAALYDAGFSDGSGPNRRQAITPMSIADFKKWLKGGTTEKPAVENAPEIPPHQGEVTAATVIADIDRGYVKPNVDDMVKRYDIFASDAARILDQISRRPDTPIEIASGKGQTDPSKLTWRVKDADRREATMQAEAEWARQNFGLDRTAYPDDQSYFDDVHKAVGAREQMRLMPYYEAARRMGYPELTPEEASEADWIAGHEQLDPEAAVDAAIERSSIKAENEAAGLKETPHDFRNALVEQPEKPKLALAPGAAAPRPSRPTAEPQPTPTAIAPAPGATPVRGAPEAPTPAAEVGTPDAPNIIGLGQYFRAAFAGGIKFDTIRDARAFAAQRLGGEIKTPAAKKALDEAIEYGLMRAARDTVHNYEAHGVPADEIFNALVDMYERQPILGERNADSALRQAFSTPAPIAYLVSRLANVSRETSVYEPTAGNGMLLLEADPDHVIANEIDPARAAALRTVFSRVTSADAVKVEMNPDIDIVLANPPFGRVVDDQGNQARFRTPRYVTRELDHAIAFQALSAMKDDGRAVLIVASKKGMGRGAEEQRQKLYNSEESRAFFKALYNDYRVTDHFTIAGELYNRQGAAWPIDIIKIEGRGKSDLPLPGVEAPRIYDRFDQLAEIVHGTDRVVPQGEQPTAVRGAGEPGRAPAPAVPRPAGEPPVRAGKGRGAGEGEGTPAGVRPGGEPGVPAPAVAAVERPPTGQPTGARPAGEPPAGNVAEERPPVPEPASAPSAEQHGPRSVARTAVPARGLNDADLNKALNDALEHAFAPGAEPARAPTGSAGDALAGKVDAEMTDKAIADAARDIDMMFNRPPPEEAAKRTDLDPDVDPTRYAFLEPLMLERATAIGLKDEEEPASMVQRLIAAMRDRYNITREKLANMLPYFRQFIKDVKNGITRLADAISRRRKNEEQETKFQVQYTPVSNAEPVGTLVPANMLSSITGAMKSLRDRIGDFDHYVANKLGYPLSEVVGTKDKPGRFSAEQVDAIAMAIDNMERGGGAIVGDMTGVGKGRVVAAVLRYAAKNGKVPIFVTAKPGLYADMYRDTRNIGWKDFKALPTDGALRGKDAVPLNADGTEKLMSPPPATQKALFNEIVRTGRLPLGYDALFTTYSQMQFGADQTPYQRHAVMRALAPNAVIVLDESHLAGGTEAGQRAKVDKDTGLVLGGRAGFARELLQGADSAVYSSATYAKNPHVMSLYFRTDMPLAVEKADELTDLIKAGGVPLQQVVAKMLVDAGQYARRERSYEGVDMKMESVPADHPTAERVSSALRSIFEFDRGMKDVRDDFAEELAKTGDAATLDPSKGEMGVSSVSFSSIMHNVIGQALLSLKSDEAAQQAIAAWREGRKPIIAVHNTFGALLSRYVDENGLKPGDDLKGLTFNRALENYLRRTREVTVKDPHKPNTTRRVYISDDWLREHGHEYALSEYEAVRDAIHNADLSKMPASPIDHLIDTMRAAGMKVAEVTGRGHVIDNGTLRTREHSAAANTKIANDFNYGKLDALIINESGSTGISLHTDPGYKDFGPNGEAIPPKPRHMALLQAHPNIDTFMQMLGRVHRTGQIMVPRYSILASDLPAEKRPAAILMRKLGSLNANTSANRDSAVSLKNAVDFLNQYGDEVVGELLHDEPEIADMLGVHPDDEGKYQAGVAAKATGRLAILPIAQQEEVYGRIERNYLEHVGTLNRLGRNALEAKTLDLDAKTLESKPITEDRGVDSPFAKPAVLEKVSAKRLGRPYTPEEVDERIAETYGVKGEISKDVVDREVRTAQAKLRTDGDEYLKDVRQDLADAGAEIDRARAEPDGEMREQALARAEKHQKAIQQRLSSAEEARGILGNMMSDFRGGRAVHVTVGSEDNVETFDGITLGVVRDSKGKNPLAFSHYTVRIAVADGSQEIKIPLSKIKSGAFTVAPALDATVRHAFVEGQAVGREERHVVTGNLLAGFAKFNGVGQITMFRDAEGNIRSGILLPRKYDAEAALSAKPVPLTTGQALQFIDSLSADRKAAFVKSDDGVLSVQHTPDGSYLFKANTKGGKPYYLNRAVNEMLGGDQYAQRRGAKTWDATASRDTAERVMQYYEQNLGIKFTAEHEKDRARAIAQGTPRLSRAIEQATQQAGERKIAEGLTGVPATGADALGRERTIKGLQADLDRMAPGARIEIMRSLRAAGAKGPTDKVYGAYWRRMMDDGTIARMYAMSLDQKDPRAAFHHEVIHDMKRAGLLTKAEWGTLEQAARAGKWVEKYGVAAKYPHLDEAGHLEEAVAEHFSISRGAQFKDAGPLRPIFQRIANFLRSMATSARQMFGKDATAEDIFNKIQSGEIGRRAPTATGESAPVRQAGKQPWQMTRAEHDAMLAERVGVRPAPENARHAFEARIRGERAVGRGDSEQAARDAVLSTTHYKSVSDAITRGEAVPPEVLRESPALAALARQRAAEPPLIETKPATPEQQAAARAAAQKQEAELRMRGKTKAEVPQKNAEELPLFGEKGKQETLFSMAGPDSPDEDDAEGPMGPRFAHARAGLEKVSGRVLDVWDDVKQMVAPMTAGTPDSQAIASRFADAMRLARDEGGKILRWLAPDNKRGANLSPKQLRDMWEALDEHSRLEQDGLKEIPPDRGLNRLAPYERGIVDQLVATAKANLRAMNRLGMFKGAGIPHWTPRMFVDMAEGVAKRLPGGAGTGPTSADHFGKNLSTSTPQLMKRKYFHAEESDAAAKEKYGEGATLVRDIRTLALANMQIQEAIAGRSLINAIKNFGDRTGALTVSEGGEPTASQYKWFTLKDHPAFMTRRAKLEPDPDKPGSMRAIRDSQGNVVTEKVPIYIRGDFEGPLKAVLSRDSNEIYKAVMDLKGRTMSLIMYSPLIHNGVEWGRALPAMPMKVATFKVYFEGNRAKNDPAQMREFITHTGVPVGRYFGFQDITSVLNEPNIAPGRSITAKLLAAVPGLFSHEAGDAVKRAVDRMGNLWHNTLLWDRVADLQMGLYVNFRDKFTKDLVSKGTDPAQARDAAAYVAAHLANRFAGALPIEAMSTGARQLANFLFFSRTFTLGNLGLMKDAMTGLPQHVQARIGKQLGGVMADYAKSVARRKAIAAIAMDIGLMYVGNAALQSAIAVMSGDTTLGDEASGYVKRLGELAMRGKEDPLDLLNLPADILALTPQANNEPGKQDRILTGYAADGTAIYMRNPTGKIGEEFLGWLTSPLDMLHRKAGTIAKPLAQVYMNDDGWGHPIYNPYADTPSQVVGNIGNIVELFLGDQVPLQSIKAARDLLAQRGDAKTEAEQIAAPLAGVTFSSGYPGGPAGGERARTQQIQSYEEHQAMPAIRRQIQDGDIAGATSAMQALHIDPGLQRAIIRSTLYPSYESRRAARQFMEHASPEALQRYGNDVGNQAHP